MIPNWVINHFFKTLCFLPEMTVLAMFSLNFCRPIIFSSIVSLVISLKLKLLRCSGLAGPVQPWMANFVWNFTQTIVMWNEFLSQVWSASRRGTHLYTLTTLFWPIRWALSMAWRSLLGFQSCSTKMTVSAPVDERSGEGMEVEGQLLTTGLSLIVYRCALCHL